MNTVGAIITIVLVVIWVVRGVASVMGANSSGQAEPGKVTPEEIERRIAARQRAMRQAQQQMQAQAGDEPRAVSQMSMTERIELARERARQEAQRRSAGGQEQEVSANADALRQSREQAQQEAAKREQADRLREMQARQRAQRQQEQAQREARRRRAERASSEIRRKAKPLKSAGSAQPSPLASHEQQMREASYRRVHHGQSPVPTPQAPKAQPIGRTALGTIRSSDLRKAFIMKEVIDKPLALRASQDDLLS